MFCELHLGDSRERMRLAPRAGDLRHSEELDAAMVADVAYQPLEHQQPMAPVQAGLSRPSASTFSSRSCSFLLSSRSLSMSSRNFWPSSTRLRPSLIDVIASFAWR